ELDNSLKSNIKNRYQLMKKSIGLGLTIMSIISVSLILAGMMAGPFGAPVIAAGVTLGAVTTAIVVGGMIVDYARAKKANEQARNAKLGDLAVADQGIEMEPVKDKIVPSNAMVLDRMNHAEAEPSDPIPQRYTGVVENDEDEPSNPFLPAPNEKVSQS